MAGTPAEDTETQTRDNKAAQILTSKRYEPVPETNIEVPADNRTDVRTYNYADAPTSTPFATESLDDTVSYANKSAREIEQQDAFVSDTGTSYRGIEFNPEPNYSTADYAAPESTQSEPVRPESSAASTIENPDSQTTGYVPGSRILCGVTEVEFYEWFKKDPDAAWEFIWICYDIQ